MDIETEQISIEKIEKIAEVLKTIGHPVRLEILQVLRDEEPLSVSEILKKVNMDIEQSLLSHHLIKMKDKGLLNSERRGMHKMYSIEDRQILKIFACMENCSLD